MLKKLWYLFRTFLLLGAISFGGYMALISVVRQYLVERKKMIDDRVIAEGISIASFLPGPVAVNVVAYAGFHIAGILGSLISITAVLIPSFLLVLGMAIVYSNYSQSFPFDSILVGITPVVVGIVASVGYTMGKKNCRTWVEYLVLIGGIGALYFFPGNYTILILFVVAGLVGIFYGGAGGSESQHNHHESFRLVWIVLGTMLGMIILFYIVFHGTIFTELFTLFSKVSLTLFGGGYVMVPILQDILVDNLQWLNQDQFVYGISIGQVTPGPILISSAFFGYTVAGIGGAILATIGIFLPSSLLMILASKFFFLVRSNVWVLSAINMLKPLVAGLILFASASIFVGQTSKSDYLAQLILAGATIFLILRFKISPSLLVAAGALIGYIMI